VWRICEDERTRLPPLHRFAHCPEEGRMSHSRPYEKTNAAELAGLIELASERSTETVERVLVAAREMLGMDVAFVAEFAEERMVFRALGGDAESFGWRKGASMPLDGTYYRGLVEGRLPSVVSDAGSDEHVKNLDITREADIGALRWRQPGCRRSWPPSRPATATWEITRGTWRRSPRRWGG
jgi:hypothetical protein